MKFVDKKFKKNCLILFFSLMFASIPKLKLKRDTHHKLCRVVV